MAPKNRIIIDTDPGVDDVLAMLLALSASPEELEIVMLSVTYGNVPLQSCLRNIVALFHVLEKELAWRESVGRTGGTYGALKAFKPIVALGADHPLEEELLMADHFHGVDGLHGVHAAHPDLTPADTWRSLFPDPEAVSTTATAASEPPSYSKFFTPSATPAHREILNLLRDSPADTITIVAIGPLTNVALAAAEDPETFLRAKELVVMGGAVNVEGNITPVAEFNCYADAVATARVYALTSPNPASTMPPAPPTNKKPSHEIQTQPPYPEKLSRPLNLTLFPLDLTTPHLLKRGFFTRTITPHIEAGSPLARWCSTILLGTFNKIDSILGDGSEAGLSLHDPSTIWYMLLRSDPKWKSSPAGLEDIRVETSGQWTRGMHVIDRRTRARKPGQKEGANVHTKSTDKMDEVRLDEVPGDTMGWLSRSRGNRINRIVSSPGEAEFPVELMRRIFE